MKRSPYALAAACAVAVFALSGCMGYHPWGDSRSDTASMPQQSAAQESARYQRGEDYHPLPVHDPR